jgi:hypothetical protein
VETYERFFVGGGDGVTHDGSVAWEPGVEPAAVVYANSRAGHRWPIRNENTFESVIELIENDPWCDLQMHGAYCLDGLRKYPDTIHAYTFPVARGDIIIFLRFCFECWQAFLKENRIKPEKCRIQDSYSDGFGSVGWLDNIEHRWPKKPYLRNQQEYLDFLRDHPNAGPVRTSETD